MKAILSKAGIKFLESIEGLEEIPEPIECNVEIKENVILIKLLREVKSPIEKMMKYIENPISCDVDTLTKALEVDDA